MKAGKNGEYDVVTQETWGADFDTFFERFASDSIFQKKHMNFPVRNTFEYDDDDYYAVHNDITAENYHFLDIVTEKQAGTGENKNVKVTFTKHEELMFYEATGVFDDVSINMTFKLIDGCWYLTEMYDFEI